MIPWLLVIALMFDRRASLSSLVQACMAAFPCSGEINFRVNDVGAAMALVLKHFSEDKPKVDYTDRISLKFSDCRFNLRASNTEPLLCLNVEADGDLTVVSEQVTEIGKLIQLGSCQEIVT